MAYKNFKLKDLNTQFGIVQTRACVIPKTASVEPSSWLRQSMTNAQTMLLTSEKALSEWLISPILTEIKLRNIQKIEMYSGSNLEADKAAGLNGECDFIFSLAPGRIQVESPVFSIVEAKQGELEKAIAQAGAQMFGAQIFNQKDGREVAAIHGAVSDGRDWLFLRLENKNLVVDEKRFSSSQLPDLLGALQWTVDFYG